VRVSIGGDYNSKHARVHAWAFKFFPESLEEKITDKLGSSSLKTRGVNVFVFSYLDNIFLSKSKLIYEKRYVMERKTLEKTIGIFLEKPSVLLKRNYI